MLQHTFPLALTFSDISLVPKYSSVLPSQVDTFTELGRGIALRSPILSAAMDTVTMSDMAIAMAKSGGLGVIHKNLSIDEQVKQVKIVKSYDSGVILNPVTISPKQTIAQAKELASKNNISGFPVVNENNVLVGMITARDIAFASCESMLVEELMSRDLAVACMEDDDVDCMDIMKRKRVEKLPLVDENQTLKGLVTIKDINRLETFPEATRSKDGKLACGAAVGVEKNYEQRCRMLVESGVDCLVVDSAHAHSQAIIEVVSQIRQWFPNILIIAGNVVTAQGAVELFHAGADVIKVGIGPGSICTTRIVAGVGIPQFSAILEVSAAAKKYGFKIIADGGIQYSGDFAKAMAGGAHAIMLGSLLAGTKEAPGEMLLFGGREYKTYRGMGSIEAMKQGSKERYGQGKVEAQKLVAEGVEAKVPYRGKVADVLYQMVGGLKASMGYLGSKDIAEFQKNAQFVRTTPSGLKESHVHDVSITKENQNYYMNHA